MNKNANSADVIRLTRATAKALKKRHYLLKSLYIHLYKYSRVLDSTCKATNGALKNITVGARYDFSENK